MHSFLRSVGFSNIKDRKDIDALIKDVCLNCDTRNAVRLDHGQAFVEYRKEFGTGCGLAVCGEIDENGFHYDYYFPYFQTDTVSSTEDLSIEKHGGEDSFAGVCEDNRLGTSLIFYVQNAVDYMRACLVKWSVGNHLSTSLTGLASDGKILLPLYKDAEQVLHDKESAITRSQMINAAKNGDQDAIDSLTLEEMDTYSMVSRRIQTEDVFTIVDTFFMPFGMECDHYQIMGEIQSYRKVKNIRSKEYLYQMKILCNDIEMDVCINEADLLGDPDVGRRFKGNVWLQGYIHFPDD